MLPCIVTVTSALTAAPSTSPVDAFTPDGMSTASTGAPAALIRSIVAAASARGAPRNPVPSSASMTRSAPLLDLLSPCSSTRMRAAILPSPPFAPPPAKSAKRRASGKLRCASSATARPARSISTATSCPASAAFISSAV